MRKGFISNFVILVLVQSASLFAQDNTFYGISTGQSITTGDRNTFLGAYAGRDTTSGSNNTFTGYTTGILNTTGRENSFYGSLAGGFTTTGIGNSFFGYYAGLQSNGSLNSVFGHNAGAAITSGGGNSFFGASAGASNTWARFNSFFGHLAGQNNTTGELNTFIGTRSGLSTTTGRGNTFVGNYSGQDHVSGSYNTALGASTEFAAENFTYATTIGAWSTALTSNSITLGRKDGEDAVFIPGHVWLNSLYSGGNTVLCRNNFNYISTCSSSARYKTNIHGFRPGLDLLRYLRPVSFNWKDGGMLDLGLVAEEVAEVEPLLVTYNERGQVEGVKYDRIGVVLVNAVKEQQSIIEKQQRQIDELKAVVCEIRNRAQVCRK